MKLASIHQHISNDVESNRERFLQKLEACETNTNLVIGPEAVTTGLIRAPGEMDKYSETLDGYTVSGAQSIVDEKQFSAIFGIVEKKDEDLYNTSVMLEPDSEPQVYRQVEHEHTYDWQTGFGSEYKVFESELGTIGSALCADITFEDTRDYWDRKNIDLMAIPANWYGEDSLNEWVNLSDETDVPLAVSNIEGSFEYGCEVEFDGFSAIIDDEVITAVSNPEETLYRSVIV